MATLIPIVIGRKPFDADSRVARVILWLLCHQKEVARDQVKLTVNCGRQGIKYSVEAWYEDKDEDQTEMPIDAAAMSAAPRR